MRTVKVGIEMNSFEPTIQRAEKNSNITLYQHQFEAQQKLDGINRKDSFGCLIVFPTGGGKTLTLSHWLMRNAVNKGYKVIWIAHRQMLLEQAYSAFKKCAFSDLLNQKESFTAKIISGKSHSVKDVRQNDDVLFVSANCINNPTKIQFLDPWLSLYDKPLFCIIDEAHHSAARTYQVIHRYFTSACKQLKLIGITATPFRTVDKETALLKRVFPQDIIYKIDLNDLIEVGILSQPILHEIKTQYKRLLSEEEVQAIVKQHKLIESCAVEVANDVMRNHVIVNTYIDNRRKYGKTIIFAVNQRHAIELRQQFEMRGIKAGLVICSKTKFRLTNEDDTAINDFREGNLDILINVNILTEGIDLPMTKTVFLTRPTLSKILMTQMVGRALRGETAGGTSVAYIVSFIDDWYGRIAWVSPAQLEISAACKEAETRKQVPGDIEDTILESDIKAVVADTSGYIQENDIQPEYSLETLSVKYKFEQFSNLTQTYPLMAGNNERELTTADKKLLVILNDENEIEIFHHDSELQCMIQDTFSNPCIHLTQYFYEKEHCSHINNSQAQHSFSNQIRTKSNKTDPYLTQVIDWCRTHDTISTSFIQRKFGVGYARAGRIIDELEKMDIVGKANGAKARAVFKEKIDSNN